MNSQAVENFQILREQTIDYGGGCDDKLYVMLIKSEQRYFITVDSRTLRIGQREVYSFSGGCTVMEQVVFRMSKYKDIHAAFKTLD